MERSRISGLGRRILSCSEVEELLDGFIDRELAPPMTERIEHHLGSCEYCRDLISDCQHLVTFARSLAEAPIPQTVSARLRQALREQVGHDAKPVPHLTLIKPDSDS